MAEKNGSWLKIGAISAFGGLIVIAITILSFAGGIIDSRIDSRLIEHDAEQAPVQQKIQQDIAVIQVQQKEIKEDIKEIKELIRDGQ